VVERTIASLHRYSNRFFRSTDLVRDFNDSHGLDGYWLTDFGRTCLSRIATGLDPNSGRRTWRLTGDFGSGKSSFALLLANAFSERQQKLPKGLKQRVFNEVPEVKKLQFIPVLVIGNREALAPAILRALYATLSELFSRGSKSSLVVEIEKALARKIRVDDKEVLDFLQRANSKLIESRKGSGLLLILDEVGKFLEFAAINPEQQDVYFLQQLAEMAARSGKRPIVIVCLLHQGFNAYTDQLTETTRREWDKIAGRFEEIIFQQPLDQIALLISSAISVDSQKIPETLKKQSEDSLNQAIHLGWFGTSASRETLKRLQHRFFPLDPMLLPVLVRTFHRFGQNERSLFSFLCSYEPFGLRAFSNSLLSDKSRMYRLADFFDYLRTNFGHRLAVANYQAHWNVIESTIEVFCEDNPEELRVIKTVGVLNLLSSEDFLPTQEAICWAVAGNSVSKRLEVLTILKKLERNRVLHFRGEVRGYSLWPYTSVDIESRLSEAKRALPKVSKIAQAITDHLDSRPIVARAHYIQTGNLRYFDVVYCNPDELKEKASSHKTTADGVIFVPLCETDIEHKKLLESAENFETRTDRIQILAVPRPLNHLNQAALDAQRWKWVQENTPQLNNDRFAREEVELNLSEARNRLQTQIQSFIGLNRVTGRSTLSWFYRGEILKFETGRLFLNWLSTLCDNVFTKAPRIKNELINRQNISSAAKAARMRLIDLMFLHSDKADLGMPADRKPPEKSMYLSVLKEAGLHQERGGNWKLGYPSAQHPSRLLPVLNIIRETIINQPDTRIKIQSLMQVLRQPPYGLRDGLFPVLLAVVAITDEQEIAFYENGTFLREVGKDAFLRMTRAPQNFDIQYCKIEGVRSELFQRLIEALEMKKSESKEIELLDVVRKLCQFVAQLPEYARNSGRLSKSAKAVRDIILLAQEPVRMVFHDLPLACGFQKFEIGKPASQNEALNFVVKLKEALDELRMLFSNLQQRMELSLSQEFGYADQLTSQYRKKLSARCEQLLFQATESKLKAFAFRLADNSLPGTDWLESVGSFLALRPPSRWKDEDEDTFDRELSNLGGRFKRVESATFSNAKNGSKISTGLRIAVTRADGSERQEVIHFDTEEQAKVKLLQEQISAVIAKDKRLGVAAASQALWSQMKPSEDNQ
jgi:hypothetical protein